MDAITLLKEDHKTVSALFRKYESLGERAMKSKQSISDRIVKELSIHAAIEEQVLYPAIRRAVPNGDALVDHALDEHQGVKEALARLERLSPDRAEFDEVVGTLIDDVRGHVKEEESDVFPKLRKAMGRTELQEMAELLKQAKRAAPTHPHPRSPARPPANIVTGAVAGFLDKLRDIGREATSRR